jgi:transposase
MDDALRLIGYLLGGEAGARATLKLAMKTSADTWLRRVRAAVKACAPTPRVLGVDDFAFRRGQRYGTILVDLERRRVIDLLADREAATLAAWLRAHPGVEVVSRDRSPSYACGINEGAPGTLQVADRFHRLMNVREVLEKVMYRQNRLLRSRSSAAPTSTATTEGNDAYAGCRLRLLPHLTRPKRVRRREASPQLTLPAELSSFANGITADIGAVRAALEHEWSNGQTEGQVHRLKLVKRQMYGRGKLDLLRARVLYAA